MGRKRSYIIWVTDLGYRSFNGPVNTDATMISALLYPLVLNWEKEEMGIIINSLKAQQWHFPAPS